MRGFSRAIPLLQCRNQAASFHRLKGRYCTMTNIQALHRPQWRIDGVEWHLIVGNRSVAKLIPNFDPARPRCRWLSIIDGPNVPWHAVDFADLDIAKFDLEQWWLHMCRGEAYHPSLRLCEAFSCPCLKR
jgi:hypothetical protein